MQDQKKAEPATKAASSAVPGLAAVKATATADEKKEVKKSDTRLPNARPSMMPHNDIVGRIVDKVKASENILVTLSRDPSVDELAAAIGLAMFLDGLQKHTTAIYSGKTPDALQFLQPEGTFETNTDSLQDFIISLNKDKADHLRYKLDGDFVRVYITPYKSLITEEDLEFSRGDYNVDLVLALGVPAAADLDEALVEYGRIMHDATTVNITCDAPGKFSEIEWSDPGASSVSEMVTKLIFAIEGKDATLDKDVATALLTGIVAATGRFSNDRTNSETLQLASKLMSMGADQQLISAHVMDNSLASLEKEENDGGELDVARAEEQPVPAADTATVVSPDIAAMVSPEVAARVAEETAARERAEEERKKREAEAAAAAVNNAVAAAAANAAAAGATGVGMDTTERKDYAQMMEEALSEPITSANIPETQNNGMGEVMAVPGAPQAMAPQVAQPVVMPAQPMSPVPPAQAVQPTEAVAVQPVQMAQPQVMPPQPAPGMAAPVASPAAGSAEMAQTMQQPQTMSVTEAAGQPQAAQNVEATPVQEQVATGNAGSGENGTPVVAEKPEVVLPPPPDPTTTGQAMPPVLPEVQVPPEMKQSGAEALAANPGAFHIPGVN